MEISRLEKLKQGLENCIAQTLVLRTIEIHPDTATYR